jgi:hypothetical protein
MMVNQAADQRVITVRILRPAPSTRGQIRTDDLPTTRRTETLQLDPPRTIVAAQIRDRFHLVPSSSAWCQRLGCHSGYQVAPYTQRPGGGLAAHCREPLVLGGHPDQGRRRPGWAPPPIRPGEATAPPLTGPQHLRTTVRGHLHRSSVGSVAGSSVDTATARQNRHHDPRQWVMVGTGCGSAPGVWAGVTTRGPGLPAPGCRQGPRPAGRRGPGVVAERWAT